MSDAAQAPIYPRYCFQLSPTVNAWCFFRVIEIYRLDQHAGFEGENFYFYKNLPIKWVRIVGVVVAIDEFAGRRIFTVDDSSGKNIEAIVPITQPVATTTQARAATASAGRQIRSVAIQIKETTTLSLPQGSSPYADINVGSVVDVKGLLSTFRSECQIKIEKMVCVKATNQEVALWEKRSKFRREVLDKPWMLREKDVRKCRKEAERSEAETERKRERLKAITRATNSKTTFRPREEKPLATTSSREKGDSRDLWTSDVNEIIRGGAAAGKFSALGL